MEKKVKINYNTTFSTTHSRDFYKGTSFHYSGKWIIGAHYNSDKYNIDFVVHDQVLLACAQSHLSSLDNEPIKYIHDERGNITGVVSIYWDFVLSGIKGNSPGIKIVDKYWYTCEDTLLPEDKQVWINTGIKASFEFCDLTEEEIKILQQPGIDAAHGAVQAVIVQETGNNTDKIMSQDAVTKELNKKATKVELTEAIANEVARAENTYQPKGDYATNHRVDVVQQEVTDLRNSSNAEFTNVKTLITEEQERATAAESDLKIKIDTETSNRETADTHLANLLKAEVIRATTEESKLNSKIETEISARESADTTLTNALNSEITRATTAEEDIQESLDNEITRATNKETELLNAINTETADRKSAIQAETTRATAAESALQNSLDAEIARAKSAEQTNATNIAQEVTDRTNAISAEQTARINADNALDSRVTTIESKIPIQASSTNQLADKAFVNSSIATSTAVFKGTFTNLDTLKATSADDNDYAFYSHVDSSGNTQYDKYKYTASGWVFEYTLNNSSFTSEQWAAINSGVTASIINTVPKSVEVVGTGNAVTTASLSSGKLTLSKNSTFLAAHQPLKTLTIQKNGTQIGTFNPATNGTINITDVASASTLNSHINNVTVHVTEAEKTKWNNASASIGGITVTTTGSGNVISSITNNGSTITATKGVTALTSHQSISHLLKIDGSNANAEGVSTLMRWLQTSLSDPTDSTMFVTSHSQGETSGPLYYKRTATSFWNYIKSKADTIYQPKGNYLTSITKAQVEAVLTGNITTHTHSQYLTSHQTLDHINTLDVRSTTTYPNTYDSSLRALFKHNNNDALADGGIYHGILHFKYYGGGADMSGGYPHQLAFTANNNLWHRIGTSESAWGAWIKLLDSNNTKISNGTITINGTSITPLTSQSLTNYVTLNTAQTISGLKTITAGLKVSGRVQGGNDDEGIVIGKANNNYAALCLGDPSAIRSVFYLGATNAAFWRYNNGTNPSTDIIHPNKSGTIALTSDLTWSSIAKKPTTLGGYGITDAKIASGTITLGANSITPITAHQSLANYLHFDINASYVSARFKDSADIAQKAGETYIEFWQSTGGWFNFQTGWIKANGKVEGTSIVRTGGSASQILMADGSVQSHWKAAEITTATSDVGTMTPLAMNNWVSNNFYKKTDADSRYVKKSGDTITGVLRFNTSGNIGGMLMLNKTDGSEPYLYLCRSNSQRAAFTHNETYGASIYSASANRYMGIKDNGTPHFQGNTLWHAGNDGSGSGLDADLLDGVHLGSTPNTIPYYRRFPRYTDFGSATDNETYFRNILKWTKGKFGTNTFLCGEFNPNELGNAFMYIYNTNDTDGEGYPRYASGLYIGLHEIDYFGSYNHRFIMRQLAFTDSNVASSTKWATARTITLTGSVTGSVSIDGSANVTLATTTNHTHTSSQVSGLATVATSGSYNDLKNKPSIPSAYTLPTASASTLGGVKIGSGINISNGVISADSGSIPIIVCSSSETSKALNCDTFYRWESAISTLTISLNAYTQDGMYHEYMFEFKSPSSSGTTLSLPSSITWLGGSAPTINAGKTYQVSIVNNLAVIGEF